MKESSYNVWVEREGKAYVFNGITGSLLSLPEEDYKALKRFLIDQERSDCSPRLLQEMAVGQMLVPDDADELKLLANRYEQSRYDPSRFGFTIVTSLGCNFDCPYCFESKYPSILDEDVQQALLQIVDDQLPKISSLKVSWFGGEPLVGKKSLLALSDAFIERCEQAGVDYSADIITNGYLLDEETCTQLRSRRVEQAQICLDGPPSVHNRMRPLAGGKPSFWKIVENLRHAVNYLGISIRMNVSTENFPYAEELFKILAEEGFSDKLTIYPGQIVGVNDGVPSPSASYSRRCYTNPEFAKVEQEFFALARSYGLSTPSLPGPMGTPCTAVRANELVVGSKGELYKCWESVGNEFEVIGNVRDYLNPNGRLRKWLKYDPFADADCRSCIALPVCMGGCAHHSMDLVQHENRCGTFRHNYNERVLTFVEYAEQTGTTRPMAPVQLERRTETR